MCYHKFNGFIKAPSPTSSRHLRVSNTIVSTIDGVTLLVVTKVRPSISPLYTPNEMFLQSPAFGY